MKLSIIVPIYNVENYVRACLESIFRQGLEDDAFEVILINDGTPDKSMDVIQDIIDNHANIIVVNQENQGLSVARNVGISLAKGEYILMPDSDDLLIDNSLPKLLELALSTKADLVVADFLQMTDEQINNLQNIPQKELSIQEKTGEQLFLEDLSPNECYVWRTLYRRVFLLKNKLRFIPGVFCQDVPFTHEVYIKAEKCIATTWLLNIYREGRPGSASLSFDKKKALDYTIIISGTWKLTKLHALSTEVLHKLQNNIFVTFSGFVYQTYFGINDNKYRIFLLKELKKNAPDLFFSNGLKQWIHSISFRFFPNLYFYLIKLNLFFKKHLLHIR